MQEPDAAPSAGNPPLAHVGVLGDSVTRAQSCADCHSGVHQPFVEEWSQSAHARSLEEEPGVFVADNPSCASCHEGKAILAAWGVTSNYAERGQTGSANNLGMTCAVCHDPHGSAEEGGGQPLAGQLRFPIDVADANQNLCMKCHQRRSQPDSTAVRGPHSPQGPMLLGDAGYQAGRFRSGSSGRRHDARVGAEPPALRRDATSTADRDRRRHRRIPAALGGSPVPGHSVSRTRRDPDRPTRLAPMTHRAHLGRLHQRWLPWRMPPPPRPPSTCRARGWTN